jgi:hypothetical protein
MGIGPAFLKIGRRIVYNAETLIAWRDAASTDVDTDRFELAA